jgi:hypothetical protein
MTRYQVSLLQLLMFFMTFTLDVRVHAKEYIQLANQEQVLQQPGDCLLQTTICAIKTSADSKYKLTVGSETVVLDADTAVVRVARDRIRVLQGTVWVQAKTTFSVETVFGEITSARGDFWVSQNDERTLVRATSSTLSLRPRGAKQSFALEKAEENWLGRVQKDGVASSGFPHALQWRDHLDRWARLYPGGKKQFTTEVKEFRAAWTEAGKRASAYHQSLADRHIASIEEDLKRRQEKQAAIEAHNRELRALYRKKIWDN